MKFGVLEEGEGMDALLVTLIPFPWAEGAAGNAFTALGGAAPQLLPHRFSRLECGGTLKSPAVFVGSCGTKWEQRIVLSIFKVQMPSGSLALGVRVVCSPT